MKIADRRYVTCNIIGAAGRTAFVVLTDRYYSSHSLIANFRHTYVNRSINQLNCLSITATTHGDRKENPFLFSAIPLDYFYTFINLQFLSKKIIPTQ